MSRRKKLWGFISVAAVVVGLFKFSTVLYVIMAVPTSSMEPLILQGDFLLVRRSFHESPHRGDVLAYHAPVNGADSITIKRVVAVGGDRVRIQQKRLYINGVAQEDAYVMHYRNRMQPFRDDFPADPSGQEIIRDQEWIATLHSSLASGELIVPKGRFFALGDNRDLSLDSRYLGCYADSAIFGVPITVLYSVEPKGSTKPGAPRPERIMKSL